MGEKCLKSILTYLDCTKYNETDIGHLHNQKHISNKKLYKKYKYCVYKLIQKFSDTFSYTLRPIGGKWLKHILTFLDWTKYNEIYISPSHTQKHVAYKNNAKSTNIFFYSLTQKFSNILHPI